MRRNIALLIFTFIILQIAGTVYAKNVTTVWSGDGEMLYDNGFVENMMRHPGGGTTLFDMELIENDAPGAGASEKGVSSDEIIKLIIKEKKPKEIPVCIFNDN